MFSKKPIDSLRASKHFSASALKSFLTCPWKFKLQCVDAAVPESRLSALVLGKAVHEALGEEPGETREPRILYAVW